MTPESKSESEPNNLSLRDRFYEALSQRTQDEQQEILSSLTERQLWELDHSWNYIGRPNQIAPKGFPTKDVTTWVLRAGRGFGKTRSGSEFVTTEVLNTVGDYAVFSRTAKELRENLFYGESGLKACALNRSIAVEENSRDLILTYPNGSHVYGFTAETPDAVRGKNLSGIWYDEFATYLYAQEVWDNSQLALRKGKGWSVITTTPSGKTSWLLKEIEKYPTSILTIGSSWENIDNLSPTFRQRLLEREGTRIGREEIYAELLDDSGVLFKASYFDRREPIDLERLERIVVAFDPATGSMTADAGEHGIVIAGKLGDTGYVLDDWSIKATPEKAARKVIEAFHHYRADRVIIERNQGGEWIPTVIKSIDPFVAVTMVHAMVGKRLRAEPVSAMYEQGRVIHCRYMKELEDQMIAFDPDRPRPKNKSPDRLDALVWAITGLFEKKTVEPKSFNFSSPIF